MSIPVARALEAVDLITGRGVFTTYLALVVGAYALDPDTATPATVTSAEIVVAGYARQTLAWSVPATNGDGYAESSNTGVLTFGPFTDPIGSGVSGIGGLAVMTTASGSGGTLRWMTSLTPEMEDVVQNDTITIDAGVIKVTSR
jgi:hypothetical protein